MHVRGVVAEQVIDAVDVVYHRFFYEKRSTYIYMIELWHGIRIIGHIDEIEMMDIYTY